MVLLPVAVAGCGWFGAKPAVSPAPRYVLGPAYQAGGVWYYPRERFEADETGLASVEPADHPPLTTDGERFDPSAMAAAHQTLQLPAIARLTNLENGRQVTVRINDRGPASPARLVAVTPRVAMLLGFAQDSVARIRLQVLPAESRAVLAPLGGGDGARLELAAAPRGEVRQAVLAPPAGATASVSPRVAPDLALAVAGEPAAPAPSIPDRLPETVTVTRASPGSLFVRLGTFGRREFAERQRARVAPLRAEIDHSRIGRSDAYRVRVGPLADVHAADATLKQVMDAGIPDARIVVE